MFYIAMDIILFLQTVVLIGQDYSLSTKANVVNFFKYKLP